MKKILILYPHFPPSNLAGVHRPRLFAQHLYDFGWDPTVLTVHEKYYEENPDWNLAKLLPDTLKVEKVSAFPVTKFRLIGDIGLRAFFQLYKRAKELIQSENINFVYIPIPSFYCALLGRWLQNTTGVKYGIDYIDPWVHEFPGSNKIFSRHWFSTRLARFLEPIAVKKVSLITGVAEGYYLGVKHRNPHLKEQALFGAMPYGAEITDYAVLEKLNIQPYVFKKSKEKMQFVYAGAMLPKAYGPLEKIFISIKKHLEIFTNVEFHFIGTGKTPDNPRSFNIKWLAQKYDLWEYIIFEHPQRIPYLDVLVHLNNADAIFILGSTEPHYTPSKTFQAVLSGKPILAVLNKESTAVHVLKESGAGLVLEYEGENDLKKIEDSFSHLIQSFIIFIANYDPSKIRIDLYKQFTAKNVTRQLANLLDRINI